MPKKFLIESLLSGYVEGRLTPEEKQHFFDLLADTDNEVFFRELLLRNINVYAAMPQREGKDPDYSGIYRKILDQIDLSDNAEAEAKSLRKKTLYRRLAAYSSAAAAVFAFAFIIGRLSVSNDAGIIAASDSRYEVMAPFGSKSEFKLPDGTRVILNAGSVLTVSNTYNSFERNVSLTGEAYFKVAKNENIPFIVSAGSISIKALGTEFNVKAYADESIIETTLVTGKVEITREGNHDEDQAVDLTPNQKAIFIKDEQSFVLEEIKNSDSARIAPVKTILSDVLIAPRVNVDQVVAWTEGKLILRGESLDKLCVELERKYDVTFVFREDVIKKFRFTGVLLDETLEQVLNVIGLTSPIRYSLEGKTVYLSSDPHSLNDYSKYMK